MSCSVGAAIDIFGTGLGEDGLGTHLIGLLECICGLQSFLHIVKLYLVVVCERLWEYSYHPLWDDLKVQGKKVITQFEHVLWYSTSEAYRKWRRN